jgi:hypothetical protein
MIAQRKENKGVELTGGGARVKRPRNLKPKAVMRAAVTVCGGEVFLPRKEQTGDGRPYKSFPIKEKSKDLCAERAPGSFG